MEHYKCIQIFCVVWCHIISAFKVKRIILRHSFIHKSATTANFWEFRVMCLIFVVFVETSCCSVLNLLPVKNLNSVSLFIYILIYFFCFCLSYGILPFPLSGYEYYFLIFLYLVLIFLWLFFFQEKWHHRYLREYLLCGTRFLWASSMSRVETGRK